MTALWVLFRKEMKESVRTFRLVVVVGVLAVFGLGTPALLAFLPEILQATGEAPPGLEIPDFTAADAVKSYLDTLGQIGLLVTILVSMGAIAVERERGTAALVLSKPVGTGPFVAAKFLALAVVLAAGLVAGGLGCYAYTALLLGRPDPFDYLVANLLAGGYLLVVLAVTVFFSALVRSQVVAGILALAVVVLGALLGGFSVLSSVLPSSLMGWAYGVALGVPDSAELGALLSAAAVTLAALLAAWQTLQRQEV